MISLKESRVPEGHSAPLMLTPLSPGKRLDELLVARSEHITQMLHEYGAVLFRDFDVGALADFDRVISALSPARMDYVYGSTPRTSLGDRIFTATEYPPSQEIPLHNESSYQLEWPLKIAFCCLTAATSGGRTPLADMRSVTRAIGETLLQEFAERRVRYVRHYHPYIDVPWQKVFQTDDREVLRRFCDSHAISQEWLKGDVLRTAQICQGTAVHPVTREQIFFNQAHLFHVSSVGAERAAALQSHFGSERLPRQTYFGDGTDIPSMVLERVRNAFRSNAIAFKWQSGDVLLLDNMRFAHGRESFQGPRKIIAGLIEPWSEEKLETAASA